MGDEFNLNDFIFLDSPEVPYDEFISKPDYEKRNSGWIDEMPYQIYTGK